MVSYIVIIIGFVINLVGGFSYLVDTLKGKIQPNRVTFIIWPISPLIIFAAQVQQGVGVSSLFTFLTALTPLLVFIATFFNKKSVWKLTPFDLFCGGLSLLGLVLWLITRVGNIAILFSILSDGFATLPTIIKAYKYPETEATWPWLTSIIFAGLSLMTISVWDFASAGYLVYYLIAMSFIYIFAKTKIGKIKR